MATYFDPTSESDRALLPPYARDYSDLTNLAAKVEKDVINQYTVPLYYPDTWRWFFRAATQLSATGYRWVFLRGFTVDANDPACDPDLKTMMKQTVADVIGWRVKQDQEGEPGVQAVTAGGLGGKAKTYRPFGAAEEPFPPNWDRWLSGFDTREPCWGF